MERCGRGEFGSAKAPTAKPISSDLNSVNQNTVTPSAPSGRYGLDGLGRGVVQGNADGRLEEKLGFLAKPKLLIVGELGDLPFDPNAAHLFFQLVSRRYERGAMLVTSNRSVGEWGAVFADPTLADAILGRAVHNAHRIDLEGESLGKTKSRSLKES